MHVFPWVVGIRGMVDSDDDSSHVDSDSFLKFLGIERKHWRVAVEQEQTALASVRAFHFLRGTS